MAQSTFVTFLRQGAVAVAALTFCSFAGALGSDATLSQRLVGEWQELRTVDCEVPQQVMSISAVGTFQVKGIIRGCGATTPFTWRGNWQVKEGKFQYVTTYSAPADLYTVGERFEDQIVSVTDAEWVMLEQSTGEKSMAYRIR